MAGTESNRLQFSDSGENPESNPISIPHELMVEVLTWLPAIYLWPLRFVNKTWFNLLTADPNFAKSHFNRSIQSNSNPSILAKTCSSKPEFHLALDYTASDEAVNLGFPVHKNKVYCSVVGICNGLICILLRTFEEVYIWNPIIRDHITIPYLGIPSPAHFGFGFCEDINAYKLVKIAPRPDCGLLVSVWTLGVDSEWRTFEDDNVYNVTFVMDAPSPVVNGCLHWLVFQARPTFSTMLVSFDLKYEVIREIEIPSHLNFLDLHDDITELREIGGCVCICCFSRENENLQIWAMYDYGVVTSWGILQFGRPEVGDFMSSALQLKPLGIIGSTGDIILQKISSSVNIEISPDMKRQLIIYNVSTQLVTNLKEFSFEPFNACMFVGSIISPRAISWVHNNVEDGE